MTIATLLMTCLIFWMLARTGASAMLTALTVAAVVCIASSNGGATSQDLKTGFLVGATPYQQQIAIVIGSMTSAFVIGLTMLGLDAAGTHYTTKALPDMALKVPDDAPSQRAGKPHGNDANVYRIVHVRRQDALNPDIVPGKYLVDAQGMAKYRADIPIDRREKIMDDSREAPKAFDAPQPQLFTSIIEGILGGSLEWGLVIIGAFIAITIELMGISALPVAVGMYIPLAATTPIFAGGILRWLVGFGKNKAQDAEADTSPGVLMSSGFIAGGTLCGLILAFRAFLPSAYDDRLQVGKAIWTEQMLDSDRPQAIALALFIALAVVLFAVARSRPKSLDKNTSG
jgi:hypothetical protein